MQCSPSVQHLLQAQQTLSYYMQKDAQTLEANQHLVRPGPGNTI